MRADIPDDWQDRSTLTFAVPPDRSAKASLLPKGGDAVSPGNVVLNWVDAPRGDRPALAHLEAQLRALPGLFEGFTVLSRGDLGTEQEPLPFVEIRFAAGQTIRQILCCKSAGHRVVLVTGTATESRFEMLRDRFVEIAKSVASG